MSKQAMRWVTAFVATTLLTSFLVVARADEAEDQQVLALFEQGITQYQSGEYELARQSFDKVLIARPSMETALRMRNMAELGVLFEMRQREELGPDADKLLDLIMRAARENKRTVGNPDQLVADFRSGSVEAYGRALVALRAHGPYAVPYVVPLLGLNGAEEQHIVGRAMALIGGMQKDACLPLIQVLRNADDDLLRSRVAGVLGQLGDARAVPALLAVWQAAGDASPVKAAAGDALLAITGQPAGALGSAPSQYVKLALGYLCEDAQHVGYTYGMSADIWQWKPAGATLPERVVYEQVPNYLYYQRMCTEAALEGLAADPSDMELRALLAASQVRQLGLLEYFRSAEFRLGGEELAEQERADAAARADKLAADVPIVLRLLTLPTVARALELTLDVGDGPASLYLVTVLRDRLSTDPTPPCAATAQALVAALDSGEKDVRYGSAIALVQSCPTGTCGPADKIMTVVSATLGAAAQRNALVLMNDFQACNTLVSILRDLGLGTIETRVDESSIEAALSLEPSIDIVFLSAGVPDVLFGRILGMLQEDPRTKGVPLYVVTGPQGAEADVASYQGIEQIMTADDLRPAKIEPIVREQVLSKSRSAFTEQEETTVLRAVRAVENVDPANTSYPVGTLEPPLVMALAGYSDEVTAAAIGALAKFGTADSIGPLNAVLIGDRSPELKVAACQAMAAIMRRTGATPIPDVLDALRAALGGTDQTLRGAAAQALSAAGLSAEETAELVRTQGLGL